MIYSTKFDSLSNPNDVLRSVPQTVPTLLRDRHTISTKQQPILLKLTHDPMMNLALIPLVELALSFATTNEETSNRERCSEEVPKITRTNN